MVLELHIWGPAFSLPSIDPRCIAAVAYLSQNLPGKDWVLIASNDLTISPTKQFPVLRDGAATIAGYDSIVSYLQENPNHKNHFDAGLSPLQQADCVAYSSFAVSSLAPLLLLSHYVSSDNYAAATRPALSAILPLSSRYVIPPKIRTAAKTSTEHLGLSALDVDTYEDHKSSGDTMSGSDQIPLSLRRVRQTVASMVRQPQHAVQFRLQALLEVAFNPLKELLGERSNFVSDGCMTSLDCLALGYLSLALLPVMPQPWLAEAMRKTYPTLCAFVHDGIRRCFGGPVYLEDALLRTPNDESGFSNNDSLKTYKKMDVDSEKVSLPWRRPPSQNFLSISTLVLESTFEALPLLSSFQQNKVLLSEHETTRDLSSGSSTSLVYSALFTVSAAIVVAGSYVLYSGLSILPTSDTSSNEYGKRHLDDMGEAGAMLAMLNSGNKTYSG